MHGKMHVKQKINEKERVIWAYWLRERDSLQEKWKKTTKNLSGALPSQRERESFEIVRRISQNWYFYKPDSRVSINRKSVSID